MNPISNSAFILLQKHHSGETSLTRAAGSFCGELITDPRPMSEKQQQWLEKLLEKAGLPALDHGEAN